MILVVLLILIQCSVEASVGGDGIGVGGGVDVGDGVLPCNTVGLNVVVLLRSFEDYYNVLMTTTVLPWRKYKTVTCGCF